jgi:F0F1-type ATP synthase membrane subunit c/vacuolar-type H+-ATPase subunit K
MGVAKALKFSFIMSVVLYAVVAFVIAGPPDWSKPLLPEGPGVAPLVGILALLALGGWAAGMMIGRMTEAPPVLRQVAAQNPWLRIRLILAAALLESGAIAGLVLSILSKDSRFAVATSAVTAVLLLMTPASEKAQEF